MNGIKVIAFDLDDTLLDTSSLLVPLASQRACEAMIATGLNCTLEQCMKERAALAPSHSHTEIFTSLAHKYGTPQVGKAIHEALEKFYNPEVPMALPLMAGAIENLQELRHKYRLYLVTMGLPEAQKNKIRALNIESLFHGIYILNGFVGEKKETAFREIIALEKIAPQQLLSIGNRLSSEIRDAKRCGSMTCYLAHGEHVGEVPTLPEDHPDFHILTHKELISTCAL